MLQIVIIFINFASKLYFVNHRIITNTESNGINKHHS